MKDGDYNVCSEDPSEEFGLMCEECTSEVEEEHQDAVPDSCGAKSRTGTCFMVKDHHGFHNFVEVKK
jgi:hypothetical protein